MSIAITEQQLDFAAAVRDWAKDNEPIRQLRERGAQDIAGLATLGLFGTAVPERHGGLGATLGDLAAGVAEAAAALVPGAVFGPALAGLVLAGDDVSEEAAALLPELAAGKQRAAVALDTAGVRGSRTADGGLVLNGATGPILDAEEDALLVLPAEVAGLTVWCLVQPGADGLRLTQHRPLDFSRALAGAELDGVQVAPGALVPGVTSATVARFAATLAAAEASGVANWCVHTAGEYARVREQFGSPIGAFQAVKHLCAEMLCRSEVADALAWDAARAADDGARQHEFAATVAAACALDAAVDNAKDCIQVLGGIGFTWEHDAHLYLRRAMSLRQLLGGSARWRRQAAELALSGTRRALDMRADTLADPETVARIRDQISDVAALPAGEQRAALAGNGYLMPHWPKPYGLDASVAEQLVIDTELEHAGVRRPDLVIGAWAVPTILQHGSTGQRERFVAPTLRGEITWCQLFSEPGAGSDLAGLRTKAQRADGGWRISGQKVWTSLAAQADWAICLARTDPDAPKHKGITYFLVDMRSPGITTRPLREITGESVFNEVFLDGVFVPDADVVGEVDGGWRLARTTLANERVSISRGSSVGEGVERLLATWPPDEQVSHERLGELVARGCAASVLELRGTLRKLAGGQPGAESSVHKLIGVQHRQDVAEVALDLLGPEGAAADEATSAIQHEFLLSRCLSIAGGSTQILRNVVAERLLGLPRG